MANVNIELGYKTLIWFNANPTLVLLAGQIVYLGQTGTYKIGDGVSTLSALSFLGISSETQTLQNVTDLGNTTTNDIQFDTGVGVLLDNTSRLREGTIDAGYGGAKGIAQICAVGYELKWESGTLYVMDGNGTHIRHSLYNFASIPSATEDISKGFLVGTRWSLDNGDVYVCTDNTITAAVWVLEASDFTSAEKTKLSGIATGAEVNVNADWNATSGDAEILNKPTIGVGDMTKAVYDVDNTGIVDNAEAIIIVGRNATGSTLRKGTIIYILGSTGNRPNFVKAQANSEATSAGTFGVIVNDIANNTDGNCCVLGYLDTLDTRTTATYPFTTDTLADGDTIYLSPTTAGYITNVKPLAPNHLVYLGKVTRTSPTNGTIIYRIQNGYELEELHNVAISSVANNEILTFESSTSLWKNKTVVSALGFTPYNATNPSGYITSSALTPYALIANPTFTTAITTPIVNGVSGNLAFANAVQTTGAITAFTFTKPNNTGQTLSTSIAGWNYNGGSRQWATGAITTQSENVWGATTYSFVGASTITNAYGNVFNAPIAGTNCTITNNFAANFTAKINVAEGVNVFRNTNQAFIGLNTDTVNGDFPGIWFNQTTSRTVTNYAFLGDSANTIFNAASTGSLSFRINNLQKLRVYETGNIVIQNAGTFTDAGFRLDINGTGRFQNTLTLATGTTAIAPLKLTAGTNLTTPVSGSFEFDGTNLYFTVGGVRKTVTLI